MTVNAVFVHTNLVARDWEKLARFYEEVFGCVRVLPERHLSGQWLEKATKVPGAEIHGVHLSLPGFGSGGPTLEIFQYNRLDCDKGTAVNRQGFAHIAFLVADVEEARNAVFSAGGGAVGDFISRDIPGVGKLTFAYVTDPEGNVLELQKWTR